MRRYFKWWRPAIVGFVVVVVGVFGIGAFFDVAYDHTLHQTDEAVLNGVQQDEQYLLQQARELATKQYIRGAAQIPNTELTALLQDEQRARGLGGLLVTNGDGLVLARSVEVLRRSDYIFPATPYGRALFRDGTVATFDVGAVFPFVVIGGVTIDDTTGRIGSVVPFYPADDAYAHRFRDRYLGSNRQLVFYSKTYGVTGSTFDDSRIRALIAQGFHVGSDYFQKGITGTHFIIEGQSYAVRNIAIPGVDESVGGALVFVPHYHIFVAAALAGIIGVVLVGLTIFMYRRHRKGIPYRGFILGIVIAMLILGRGYKIYLDHKAITLLRVQGTIYNATLSLDPAVSVFDRVTEQPVRVLVDTGGESINAVAAVITFDPLKIHISDVIIDQTSICSPQLVLQKDIDNENGRIDIECLIPNPGFVGLHGMVARLMVSPQQEGSANMVFSDDSRVLANDGLGTNVLRLATGAGYQIIDQKVSDKRIPIIFSESHPNQAAWYSDMNAQIAWQRGASGEEYRFALDQSPDAVPSGSFHADTSARPTMDHDGIYYFHLQGKIGSALTPVAHFEMRHDVTPPEVVTASVSEEDITPGDIVRFSFSAADATSGLQSNFYVQLDNGLLLPVGATFYTTFPSAGNHTVRIRVFDKAGNYTDNVKTIRVH